MDNPNLIQFFCLLFERLLDREPFKMSFRNYTHRVENHCAFPRFYLVRKLHSTLKHNYVLSVKLTFNKKSSKSVHPFRNFDARDADFSQYTDTLNFEPFFVGC